MRGALRGWVGTGGVGGTPPRLGYVLTPDRTGTSPPAQPTDGRAAARCSRRRGVAAEAGPRGIIPLQVEGEQVAARVVGVIRALPVDRRRRRDRRPADDGDAARHAVARARHDRRAVARRAASAGSGNRRPPRPGPVHRADGQSHAATLRTLEADPLARGALLTLAGTAAVALLLALVGLLLAVVCDVRDDRGELFDLEAQGAAPATIRAHLRLRALLVAAFGIVGGLVLGAILSALVISLVSVTAGAAEPEPPLRLALDWPLLALAAVAYVVARGAARRRGDEPARPRTGARRRGGGMNAPRSSCGTSSASTRRRRATPRRCRDCRCASPTARC